MSVGNTKKEEKMGRIIKANCLVSRGMEPSLIKRLCHMQGSPFFQTKENGTWRVDEEKLDKFLDKLAKGKKAAAC